MARIDFYILNQAGTRSRQAFACRLAEKAYRLDNTVHIHAGSRDDAEFLDELLWTFRDGSFVPHELLASATAEPETPVTIGYGEAASGPRDLLINLCDGIPGCADSFPRVAELVSSDEDCRSEGRRRFVEYRERGHALETHKV
jgi:DNA polymerase-3 subunit chi